MGDIPHATDGRPRIGARVPIPGLGWVAGASRPREEALTPVLHPLRMVLALMILTVVLSVAAALVIGGLIVRDVRRLRKHTILLGTGDLEHTVSAAAISELRDLASAFNDSTSKRRQAEEAREQLLQELRASHDTLEQRVADRTVELREAIAELKAAMEARTLLQEQLHQSEKMAAVGRLASGLGHDFGNLMATILSSTSMAKQALPDRQRTIDALNVVDDAGRQARGIVESLLTFAGASGTRRHAVNLCAVLNESAHLLRHTLSSSIKLVCAPCEPPLWTHADPVHVEQVLLNLAINARDAMPKGGTLEITLSPVVAGDGMAPLSTVDTGPPAARLTVRDTGTGIRPEVIPHIFEPFFTTKPHTQGTGLGLSIVHGIVEKLRGTIDVQSEPGKGTAFTIVLPGVAPPAAPVEPPMPSEEIAEAKGRVVLLAGGSPHARGVIVAFLRLLGFEVAQARDETAMNAKCEEHRDRLGLIVIYRSAFDGRALDVLGSLRESSVGIPAVLICDEGDCEGDDRHWADTVVLRQPFSMPDLKAAIQEAMGTTGQENVA